MNNNYFAKDMLKGKVIVISGGTPTEGELALRKSQGMDSEQLHEFAKQFIPIGRMSEPEDHVPGVLYLLSDYSLVVTGSNLRVTGGLYF